MVYLPDALEPGESEADVWLSTLLALTETSSDPKSAGNVKASGEHSDAGDKSALPNDDKSKTEIAE